MNEETARIHTQTDAAANQRERHDGQQHGQDEQHQTDLAQVGVHLVHQIFGIMYLGNLGNGTNLLHDSQDGIAIGIDIHQLYLERGGEGVETNKLLRVNTHFLVVFLQGLFLADISDVIDIGTDTQPVVGSATLLLCHVVTQHNGYRQVLPDIRRKVTSCEHGKHDHTQKNEHHSGAYT